MVDQYVNTANLIQDVKNVAEHLYVKVNGVKLDHTTHITKVIVCRVLLIIQKIKINQQCEITKQKKNML